jgi:hypothetical protein
MAFFVGAELARDGDLKDAIAGKPCSYRGATSKTGRQLLHNQKQQLLWRQQ